MPLNPVTDVLLDPEHHQGLWMLITAAASSISVLIVAVGAWVAISQLNEARILRLEQMRPFVVIEFFVLPNTAIYLRVSNIGTIMARDVHFTFDRALDTKLNRNLMELQILRSGIRSLPPGRVFEFMVDTFIGRDEKNDRYVVTVDYRSDADGRQFHDIVDLDLGLWRNTTPVHLKGLHDIYGQVERIAKALEGFNASGGGLLALSPEDVAKREEAWLALLAPQTASDPERAATDVPPITKPSPAGTAPTDAPPAAKPTSDEADA